MRNMRYVVLALTLGTALAGCAGSARMDMKWANPSGTTDLQFARDRQECFDRSGPGGFVGVFTSSSEQFQLCMEAKGYRRTD